MFMIEKAEPIANVQDMPKSVEKLPNILALRKNPILYTMQQEAALHEIAAFIHREDKASYILAGYAGTGKTTIAENVMNYIEALHKECIITAPTNQAVKVLKDKLDGDNNSVAFKTLHAILYGTPDENGNWVPSVNFTADHILIVDEASMISRTVYTDLIQEIEKAKAKVIFFGDDFQLEPVGDDPKILNNKQFELTEVKRQGVGSEILLYATCLRNLQQIVIPNESRGEITLQSKQSAAREFLQSVLQKENSIFIVGTNKARLVLNKKAREVKFGKEVGHAPQQGDNIIFIGNGNFFINGDRLTLDYPNLITAKKLPVKENEKDMPKFLEAYLLKNRNHKIILLPTIEKSSAYHSQFIEPDKYLPIDWYEKNKFSRKYELSKDVSIATYAYAVTAHKAQGSQWEKVFVHQDAFKNNPRWLYTSVTRAEKMLTLTIESNADRRTWKEITEIANTTS